MADATLALSGARTMLEIAPQLPRVRAAATSGTLTVDLAAVTQCDSAALSLLFELARVQAKRGGRLRVEHAPPTLASLARLYGAETLVEELTA